LPRTASTVSSTSSKPLIGAGAPSTLTSPQIVISRDTRKTVLPRKVPAIDGSYGRAELSTKGLPLISRTYLVALAGLASATAVALSSPVASAAGGCLAKEATINGKAVIVNCGPATVKLRYKGKNYSFKNGTCTRTGGAVMLQLGTSLISNAKGNGGFNDADLTMLSNKIPLQFDAADGSMSIGGSAKFSGIAVKGTFSGTTGSYGGVSTGKTTPFTGSWNCGGPIVKF
jgi:hypothetical protein